MGIAVVALVGLVVLLLLLASHDRSSLWVQVGKGLIDLIVVGVLGASIKLLVDEHQDRRRDD